MIKLDLKISMENLLDIKNRLKLKHLTRIYVKVGEVAELAEGARLLSEYTDKTVSRVRIPLSPPSFTYCLSVFFR